MQAIQAAAIELVEARGYDAVSVEEIAILAEVSPRSVYRHFETKEGVFLWDEGDLPLLEEVAARLAIVPPRSRPCGWPSTSFSTGDSTPTDRACSGASG